MLPLPSTVVDLTILNIAVMMQTVFSRMSTGTCGGSGKCNFILFSALKNKIMSLLSVDELITNNHNIFSFLMFTFLRNKSLT